LDACKKGQGSRPPEFRHCGRPPALRTIHPLIRAQSRAWNSYPLSVWRRLGGRRKLIGPAPADAGVWRISMRNRLTNAAEKKW